MARIPIKAARVAVDMTQEQLAEKMGVSRQSVIDWENGSRIMKPAYLRLFCYITGFTEDEIFLPEQSTESRPTE